MAEGFSAAAANAIVDARDGLWAQLHTGAPGAAGTANTATETTRKQISLNAASGGSATNDTDIVWASIAGSEDPTHITLWSASTSGTFDSSGTITSDAYTAGNTFTIPADSQTISVPVAS